MKTAAGKLGDTQQLFQKEFRVSCSSLENTAGAGPRKCSTGSGCSHGGVALQIRDAQTGPWE